MDTRSPKHGRNAGGDVPPGSPTRETNVFTAFSSDIQTLTPLREKKQLIDSNQPVDLTSESQCSTADYSQTDFASTLIDFTRTANKDENQSPKVPVDFWIGGASDGESDDTMPSSGVETQRRNSIRASVSSSNAGNRLLRYIHRKFGRTYNKKAQFRGYDFLPNDQRERERYELQHLIIIDVLDGLYLAPVKNPSRILDVGTGTGAWPMEVSRSHPNALVMGIDIEPVNPAVELPNCKFKVMDATEKWTFDFDTGFDFIHMQMVGELNGQRNLFEQMYENLNPGGWIEITEFIIHIQSPDNSMKGKALDEWNTTLRRGIKAMGTSVFYALDWKDIMHEKCCENVVERKNAVPLNSWPSGRRAKAVGEMMSTNFLGFVDAATKPIFTSVLGWSASEVEDLLVEVREQIVNTKIHAFMSMLTTFCQKPRVSYSSSSSSSLPFNGGR